MLQRAVALVWWLMEETYDLKVKSSNPVTGSWIEKFLINLL